MQTVVWIQTHLEEDVEVSLPKQEVYEEYGYVLIHLLYLQFSCHIFLLSITEPIALRTLLNPCPLPILGKS